MRSSVTSSFAPVFVVATLVTAAVTALRFAGEQLQWSPGVFDRRPGGGLSWLGIAWLVPPVGFVFGRRLANRGERPTRATATAVVAALGIVALVGVFFAVFRSVSDWRLRSLWTNSAAVLLAVPAAFAWRRAWLVLACYGLCARLPVIALQCWSIGNGSDNHYAKGPPGSDPADALFLLTMAQSLLWPLGYTTMVGVLFATLGAASVRRR